MKAINNLCWLFGYAIFLLCLNACTSTSPVTTSDIVVEHHEEPGLDEKYNQTLHLTSKQATIYRNFETKYAVTASYFSKDFIRAFEKRAEEIALPSSPLFAQYAKQQLFFVSIFVPVASQFDLSNQQLWSLKLRQGSLQVAPLLIEALKEKTYWQGFFPFISSWSKEYLLVFPEEPALASNPAPFELRINNAEAAVTLGWGD